MVYVLMKLMVADYGTWRATFDSLQEASHAYGAAPSRVFQNTSNPNEVFVLREWQDAERAEAFFASPELRGAQQKAGVLGRPTLYYLSEV